MRTYPLFTAMLADSFSTCHSIERSGSQGWDPIEQRVYVCDRRFTKDRLTPKGQAMERAALTKLIRPPAATHLLLQPSPLLPPPRRFAKCSVVFSSSCRLGEPDLQRVRLWCRCTLRSLKSLECFEHWCLHEEARNQTAGFSRRDELIAVASTSKMICTPDNIQRNGDERVTTGAVFWCQCDAFQRA